MVIRNAGYKVVQRIGIDFSSLDYYTHEGYITLIKYTHVGYINNSARN